MLYRRSVPGGAFCPAIKKGGGVRSGRLSGDTLVFEEDDAKLLELLLHRGAGVPREHGFDAAVHEEPQDRPVLRSMGDRVVGGVPADGRFFP